MRILKRMEREIEFFVLLCFMRIEFCCAAGQRMKNGGIEARKGMGLGVMGRAEHAKDNKAIRFVAVKDGGKGEEGKASEGDANQRKAIGSMGVREK